MKMLSLATMALLNNVSARNAGMGASITAEGITNIKNIAAPLIFSKLSNLQIAAIDASGLKLTNVVVDLPMPALSNIKTSFDGANNGVELNVENATGKIVADFSYTYFVTVKGTAEIAINKLGVDFDMGLATQPGTPSTELAPKLNIVKSNITINPADIDVVLSGSLVAKVASLVIPLIKSSVIPAIVTGAEAAVNDIVTKTVNPDLAKYGNEITIPYLAGTTFDYSQMAGGAVISADGSMGQLQLNGTFFDMNKPESYTIEPVVFPVHNPNGKSFQAYLTDYVVNTLLQSGFDTGASLDITYLLSKYLGVTLTTDEIAVLIPEFVSVYGSGKAITVSAKLANKAGTAKVTTDLADIILSLAGTFKVGDSVALEGQLDDIHYGAFIKAVDGLLTGKISIHEVGTLSNFQTSLGMTGSAFTIELQNNINKYIDEANVDLAKGIQIENLFNVSISDVEVNFANGYLEGGINATPAFFEGVQDLWVGYKAEVDRIQAGEFETTMYTTNDVVSFLQ